jgi:hypothetical protein
MFRSYLNAITLFMLIAAPLHTCGQTPTATRKADDITIKVQYKNHHYVGKPVAWDGQELLLLRRDGKLNMLPVANENDYQTVSAGFKPFSSETLRQQLQSEFGGQYQVSVTKHFVVVHPPGDFRVWALPFEQLYQRFRLYFSSRGIHLAPPEFLMVAVILRTRQEFDRFLEKYHQLDDQVLGYYSPKSNRVITYDQRQGKPTDQSWFFHTSTVVHEATHQSAFNTGLHSRFAQVPRWISEGLAMLFEAHGVNNSALYPSRASRINQGRLRDLKHFYQQGSVDGRLGELLSSDDLFRTDPQLAYAMSWGLTFYLTEYQPQQYFNFLSADSQRLNFMEFPSHERTNAFGKAFGFRLENLEGRMKKFILSLEPQ